MRATRALREESSRLKSEHFERICREWALYFAGDRFGDLPVQVAVGTVNDPASKTVSQVDVAVLCHADGTRGPLRAIGEAKRNDVMRLGHLEHLRRIRDLLTGNQKLDTSRTRLVCFSGAGFTDELRQRAEQGEVDLVGLDDLYGEAS